ncbi:MAG: fused MFS/spermidine synthase [Myxococcota bacterium]
MLSAVAFASGFAALVFEALWFRVAGLTFGNGIWASSIVLSAFMAGLALGNGLAARLADRLRDPIRFYALLELAIGVTGVALVALLPVIHGGLAPVFAGLRDQPVLLNTVRLVFSFALMTVPATAMGATLPVLVKALARTGWPFGRVLGRLYGWNTLGAVFGAVAAEAWLVGAFGVRGSAGVAGLIDVLVAGAALWLGASLGSPSREADPGPAPRPADPPAGSAPPGRGARWLVAAFASGLLFLALEVLWFRFLSLFVYGTSLVFAVLLAVVLAGISLGGLLAGRWIGRGGDARAALPSLALASAVGVLLTYAGYGVVVRALLAPGAAAAALFHVVLIAVPLMAPVALLSGFLFTALGQTARTDIGGDARTTGWLTLSNTIGGAIGSLVGGFWLLPGLGLERSLLLCAAGYALIAALTWTAPRARAEVLRTRGVRLGWVAAFVAAWIGFPRGALQREFLPHPTRPFHEPGSEIVAVREGVLETLVFVRASRFGEPLYYRMFTDGFSMSSTTVASRRYMKAYVYLPVALHPGLENALLISYGTGSTAKALTDTRSLQRIDVVDISPDVLEMSEVVHGRPGENPLDDPRVHTHVEDGRFYLQTSDRRYDLITSEPPPPKYSGVVNLYSREYFELVRSRLAPGGLTTYWLPVHGLSESDAKAIIRGFCDVFDDCTLWTGAGLDWMLLGTRDLAGGVSEEHFVAQWNDPVVGPELRDVGFERPGQLGATFLAGSETLRALTRDTAPLVDDFPERLSSTPFLPSDARESSFHRELMDVERTVREFEQSAFVARAFPPALRAAALPEFRWQQILNERIVMYGGTLGEAELHAVLAESDLVSLPLWMLGSEREEQRIAARAGSRPGADRVRGIGALAARDYPAAVEFFRRARSGRGRQPRVASLEIFALCMAGEVDEASRVARELLRAMPALSRQDAYWSWLAATFGMPDPRG